MPDGRISVVGIKTGRLLGTQVPSVIDILDAAFGWGYVTAAQLVEMLRDARHCVLTTVDATQAGQGLVVGVGIGHIASGDEYRHVLRYDTAGSDAIGIVKTVTVAEKYRGKGIGIRLLSDMTAKSWNQGCRDVA